MSHAGACSRQLVSGVEFRVSDENITASTFYGDNHAPKRSRLNTIKDAGGR